MMEHIRPKVVFPPSTDMPSPDASRYTPNIDTRIEMMSAGDLCSPKKIIIDKATTTGYIKLIVEAMPLAIFSYPIRSVIAVIERRALKRTTFHTSSKEVSLRVFFLQAA